MIRLHFIVEGQTEKAFVKDVAIPHLNRFDIFADVRCVETSQTPYRRYKGGMRNYLKAKIDIQQWMKSDQRKESYFTTMFDLFRLPGNFPNYEMSKEVKDIYQKVTLIEKGLTEDIRHPEDRFIPYIQVYEFETILFSEPERFEYLFPNRKKSIEKLVDIRRRFKNPELIDDDNPPSKRILSLCRDYAKVDDGPVLAEEIGMETIRKNCKHFSEWITKLENLSKKI